MHAGARRKRNRRRNGSAGGTDFSRAQSGSMSLPPSARGGRGRRCRVVKTARGQEGGAEERTGRGSCRHCTHTPPAVDVSVMHTRKQGVAAFPKTEKALEEETQRHTRRNTETLCTVY